MFLACYPFQIYIHSVWKERNRRNHGEPPLPTTLSAQDHRQKRPGLILLVNCHVKQHDS